MAWDSFIRSFWSRSWPFSNTNFSSIMSSWRFELVLKFLHLSDSQKQPGYDMLYKIHPLLDIVLGNFRNCCIPTQNLSIDENMIGFKGRLSVIQYMPKKPGLKVWVLAHSLNGYTWGWKLYTGKEENAPTDLGLAHRVVLELTDDDCLKHKGYNIYMATSTLVMPYYGIWRVVASEHVAQCDSIVEVSQKTVVQLDWPRVKYLPLEMTPS